MLWGKTFGKSYGNAGTLHRGSPPTPVTQVPIKFINNIEGKELNALDNCGNLIQFPAMKVVEVLLEFVEIKNLPEGNKGNLIVYYSKKQPDKLFNTKRSLSISSEAGEKKQVASLKCEPTGEFLFELMSSSPVSDEVTPQKSFKQLGTCSLSLEELLSSKSQLSTNKWLTLEPVSGHTSSEPILLHASISFTPPIPAPQVFQLSRSMRISKTENAKNCTRVLDQDGKYIFSLYMGNAMEDTTPCTSDLLKEVYCVTNFGEKHKLAEFVENYWSIVGYNGLFKLQKNSENDDSLFELVGNKKVKLFSGRRLDFETIHLEKHTLKQSFITAIEFSTDYPYGKAVALIDFKSKTIKATEEWIILPGITLAFLLSDILKEEIDCKIGNATQAISKTGDNGVINVVKNGVALTCGDCSEYATSCSLMGKTVKNGDVTNGAGCNAECGTGCAHLENMVKSGGVVNGAGCNAECGTGCAHLENMVKSGDVTNGDGCNAECGTGCAHLENMVKSGGVADGAGCNAECGTVCAHLENMVKSGGAIDGAGCNAECGTGCAHLENMVKSGGAADGAGCNAECGMGCAHLENMVEKGGFADCAKCFLCGVLDGEDFADVMDKNGAVDHDGGATNLALSAVCATVTY